MSTLDVVAEVLREVAPRALRAKQIAELAVGRLSTTSKTPETVVSRDLALDVKHHGASSRFLRVDRGEFVLKEALPTALYNDVDVHAAQWTRNLIAAGEIAAGVVDERSIRDLKPADVASYRQFHAFSGIGVWSRALRDAGWPDDVNAWTGSCPCQGMSSAGKRRGFADERHLWPEWFRLIRACRPTVLFTEQVASKDGRAWFDLVHDELEGIGYSCQAYDLPACCVGAPHRRQRLYIVAYARERGREILGASWLHDRGQPGNDAARRCEAYDRISGAVSDAAVARPRVSQDVGADRGDEGEGTEADQRRSTGGFEPERGGDADEARAVSDAERVVRDAGWSRGTYGRSEIELDRHGEAHGAIYGGAAGGTGCCCVGSVGLGDAGLARGGRDAGALPRTEGAGEGERIEAGDLADESLAPGADDGGRGDPERWESLPLVGFDADVGDEQTDGDTIGMVRGAADVAGDGAGDRAGSVFRPGDRIRLDGDPAWGGAVGGYWAANVEWVYCRPEPGHEDGRWRPVESGTLALVDGPAPGVGRTRAARLRGFGNAIVLPIATTFVEAVIDSFAEASREVNPALPDALPIVATPDPSLSIAQPEQSPVEWTGPREGETAPSGMLFGRVPGERWPYGPPSAHQSCCNLFPHRGSPGGLFCDCAASAADDIEYGVGA